MSRSQMASASVGSPMMSCHPLTGTWLVICVAACSGAVLEDLEEIAPLGGRERGEAPIIDRQEIHLGQTREHAGVGAVAAGDMKLVEQVEARTQYAE
jgi:hypothetical protein